MVSSLIHTSSAIQTAFIPQAMPHPLISNLAGGSALAQKISGLLPASLKATWALIYCSQGSAELINRRKTAFADYQHSHGSLQVGAGLCNGMEALHEFKCINLGRLLSAVQKVGGALFLFANLVALEENISLYEDLRRTGGREKPKELPWRLRAAITGILSNLGYIAATALTLFGSATTMALVIGILSACFGCLKILCDFLSRPTMI